MTNHNSEQKGEGVELKPCPLCNDPNPYVAMDDDSYTKSEHYWIRCIGCDLSTNIFLDENKLIAYWNTRHDAKLEKALAFIDQIANGRNVHLEEYWKLQARELLKELE